MKVTVAPAWLQEVEPGSGPLPQPYRSLILATLHFKLVLDVPNMGERVEEITHLLYISVEDGPEAKRVDSEFFPLLLVFWDGA